MSDSLACTFFPQAGEDAWSNWHTNARLKKKRREKRAQGDGRQRVNQRALLVRLKKMGGRSERGGGHRPVRGWLRRGWRADGWDARSRLARVWNNYSIPRVEISPGIYIGKKTTSYIYLAYLLILHHAPSSKQNLLHIYVTFSIFIIANMRTCEKIFTQIVLTFYIKQYE